MLGASGCGKTTLLTCIIGRRRLNSGDLWVLGGKPGEEGSGIPGPRVGYMPQVYTHTYQPSIFAPKKKKLKFSITFCVFVCDFRKFRW